MDGSNNDKEGRKKVSGEAGLRWEGCGFEVSGLSGHF